MSNIKNNRDPSLQRFSQTSDMQKTSKKIIAVGDQTLLKIDIDKNNERFMQEIIYRQEQRQIAPQELDSFYEHISEVEVVGNYNSYNHLILRIT